MDSSLQSVYRVTIEMECLIPQGQKPAFLVILHVKFKIKFKNYLIEKRDYIYLAQTLKEKSIQNFTIKKGKQYSKDGANVLRYGTETHPINETIVVEILLIRYCLFKSGPRIEPKL